MISVTIVYSWASISRKRKSWTMAKVKPNVVSFLNHLILYVDGLNNEINKSLSQINNNNKHHVFTRALYE